MANGDSPSDDGSGGASPSTGGDAPPPPMPHRHADPSVATALLGSGHSIPHLGRPRVSTIALMLIFAAALTCYLAFRPGG
ncbi:hypothetical protein [Nocardia camponoti]|uniref:hypothetical protein n=1 Tax=Nocardia camponoti TaxID=1616106 RepID=UPI00166EB1E7|nr:hypothetical protein [Nocardia camponoti]